MSDIVDRIPFGAGTGLNSDDQLLVMPKGDSRERRNVFLNDDGDYNLLSNIPASVGSYNVDSDSGMNFPLGTNTVIGYVEDKQNNAGYYFAHNSNNNHYIVKISEDYPSITPPFNPVYSERFIVFEEPNLNFNLDYKIDATVLDGNYLYWTDGLNPPRKLNISEARNLALGLSSIYASLNDESMSSVYYPPEKRPRAQLATDPSLSKSLLDKEQFQFAYTYVYEDNTETTFSPWSNLIYNTSKVMLEDNSGADILSEITDFKAIGGETQNIVPNNVILLEYTVPTDLVSKVKIYVKYGFADSWLLYDTIDVSSGDFIYHYYNDKTVSGVDPEFSLRGFYDVPITADTQEIIDDSVLVYGQYLNTRDGFDLGSNLSFSAYSQGFSVITPSDPTTSFGTIDITSSQLIDNQFNEPSNVFNFNLFGLYIKYTKSGTVYEFNFPSNYGLHTAFYLDKTVTDRDQAVGDYSDAVAAYINDRAGAGSVTVSGSGNLRTLTFASVTAAMVAEVRFTTNTLRTLKFDSKYRCGIVFMDELFRTNGVITKDDYEIETPPSISGSVLNSYLVGFTANVSNNTAPSWAKYWSFVITRNLSTSSYFTGVFAGNAAPVSDISYNATINKWQIDINREFNDLHSEFPLYSEGLSTYSFNSGDRIKIYGRTDFGGFILPSSNVYDFEIEELVTNTITINYTINGGTFVSDMNYNGIIYEIYQPSKENQEEFYFEVGGVKPISEYVVGSYNITEGDAYIGHRLLSSNADGTSPSFHVINQSTTDLFVDRSPDYGRPQAEQFGIDREQKTGLIWGGSLVPNTSINRINEFIESTNSRYLDDKFGPVVKISQMGEILQCCQLRSVSSFYLGAEEGLQANNNETLVFSNDVLGQGRRLAGSIGCTNKISYVNIGNQSFFFDKFNSSIIQYSSNGLFRLSSYKMETFFKEITQNIFKYDGATSNESYDLNMGYDSISKMLFFTLYPDTSSDDRVTIGYHVPSNRFISLYDFYPDFYGRFGRSMVIFRRGDATPFFFNYENSDQSGDRNNPMGEGLLTSFVDVHCNESSGDIKTFDSISVNANELWTAPNTGDITIQPNGKYTNGMSSRLKSSQFNNQEGIYSASFLKDMLTNGVTPNVGDLYNGRDLRGKEITIRLQNSSFVESILQYVEISGSVSR